MLPAALDVVSRISCSKTKSCSTLNTICSRIDKISDDISDQLVAKTRGNEFSVQLDEATTSTSDKDAYLICYVRFADNNDNIVEDLLFCKPILANC